MSTRILDTGAEIAMEKIKAILQKSEGEAFILELSLICIQGDVLCLPLCLSMC